ncbi:MAG: hypothetical protein ACR2PT_17855 [Endozoicomonas sp.]
MRQFNELLEHFCDICVVEYSHTQMTRRHFPMKRKNRIIGTALVATMAVTSSFTLWANSYEKGEHGSRFEHRMKGGKHGFKGDCAGRGGYGAGKFMDREYTADEISTLAEARLIKRGNPNIRVGEVKATDTGYSVTIVTSDNSLVEERNLAKNGMALEKYQHIQERKKASQ